MSDTPKFEVIDRRKMKADEERESRRNSRAGGRLRRPEPGAGPQLVVNEPREAAAKKLTAAAGQAMEMPPPPTAAESTEQKAAYDASAQRLEDLIRAQNPAMGAPPPVGFEHLVQQFYVTAMIQMGAGAQEGQRPQIDILGARKTIDLMGVLAEKTRGNLTEAEDRTLQSVLFDARMAFLELTSMINAAGRSGSAATAGKEVRQLRDS